MRSSAPATIAGVGAITMWAFLGLLASRAAVPPLELTALSFAVAALLGLGTLLATGRLGQLRQKPIAWLHGVGGLFGFHALYFAALSLAPKAEANLINYSWPLLIVLLSGIILGLPLTARHLLGAALGAAGCALLLGGGHPTRAAIPGYLCAAASAIIWAVYSVTARRLTAVPTGALAGFCAVTAALAALAHIVTEPSVIPDATGLAAILALGLGPVGGAFFLWDLGMKRGDPRLLGTLAYATPVASTLMLAAGGYAALTTATLIAAGLVAAGGLVASRAASGRRRVSSRATR